MISKQTGIFLILFVLLFIFQLYRAKYGEGISDEHFYITLGYRLAQGDALFVDDWHIAQLIGYLLYPLVQVYLWLNHSTDGIVLVFRYLYVLLHGLTSILLYFRYRQYGWSVPLAALVFFMFTPLGIMNLSYNTMGIDFMMLSLLFYGYSHRISWLLSGIFFSFAVLCTPYFVILYIGAFVFWIYRYATHRINSEERYHFVFSFLGITISFLVFIFFVFSRSSLAQILDGLPHIIDPSHQSSVFNSIFRLGYQSFQAFGFVLIIQFVVFVTFVVYKKSRQIIVKYELLLVFISWSWLFIVSQYRLSIGGYACIYLPIVLYAIMILMVKPYSDHKVVIPFWICVIYAVLIGFSSNIGIRSVANISICAVFFALIVIFAYWQKYNQPRLTMVLPLSALIITILCKAYFGYGEPSVLSQSLLIDKGPLKGLYTDSVFRDRYEMMMNHMTLVNQDSNENIILVTDESWPFLTMVKPSKNYSTYIYLYTKEDYMAEMEAYIQFHGLTNASIYIFSNRFDITDSDFDFVPQASIHMMN